jgi:very-short-patch-repair endonuclease
LLERQNQVVTRAQAVSAGLSEKAVDRRARPGGRWQRLLPGVYLAATGTATQDQRDIAALLYAGSGSALTGLAALRRHGVRMPRTDVVDVLIPASMKRQSTGFVAVHRTWRVPQQVCFAGPVQWALPARAVADAVRGLDRLSDVREIVAAAVQSRACTVEQLMQELRSGPAHGSALFREVLGEVAEGARSVPEASLMALIKRARLPLPLFNPLLYVGNEFVAKPDAWWPDAGVAVEVESRRWHMSPRAWEQTMRRRDKMTALGILVLQFSPHQIKVEPDEVLTVIRTALETRRGHRPLAIRTVAATG